MSHIRYAKYIKNWYYNIRRHLITDIMNFNGIATIEPTNMCNLKCPLCATSQAMSREKGMMEFDRFKYIIEHDDNMFRKILFAFAGEPLLNKDIFKMVDFAERRGIKTTISTNTVLLDKYIDEVFRSRLTHLIVCLDGATKSTHEAYRIGSDFDVVKRNIQMICDEKRCKHADKPHITLQFLVMRQNEHEIEKIIHLAYILGVDSLQLKTLSLGSWIDTQKRLELASIYLPVNEKFRRYTIKANKIKIKRQPRICPLIKSTVIYWNGDVTLCCYDFNGELLIGNIFETKSFKQLWYSEKYITYRQKAARKEFNLCKNCNVTEDYGVTINLKKNGALTTKDISYKCKA